MRFSIISRLILKQSVVLNKLCDRNCIRDLPKCPKFFLDTCEGDPEYRGFIVRNVHIKSRVKVHEKIFSYISNVAVLFESRLIGGLEPFAAPGTFPQREF